MTSFPPPNRDFGNNRGADPHFDPENTKVTTYIDYDNGIVVMRQNPSVEETPDGAPGRVMVGDPQGSVMQAPDGSVRVKYDAGNPFAPGFVRDPQGLFAGHEETVNGDLTFTPSWRGASGWNANRLPVHGDLSGPAGRRYPHRADRPGTVGQFTGRPRIFLSTTTSGSGGKAFEPFDRGGWNPTYDVPAPLPSTQFGPVTSPPPSVPPLPTGGAVQFYQMEHTPMPSVARIRHLDTQAWRTATWSAPFVVQLVVAALLILMWLLGKWTFAQHSTFEAERALLLTATGSPRWDHWRSVASCC